jgi:aspartate/methionine/tyrosine aminotransferase
MTRLGYGDITGSPELRAAIAALYGERVTAANVLTANGAIGANYLALFALTEPGTRVVAVKPTYQQLFSVPAALGADVRHLHLREEDGYLPDLDRLRTLADASTRLIVLNNPNNPTGALMDESMLREIVAIARERDAWLLCDEVYRMLEHEPGTTAPSVADLYEKGVSTGSMSKSYSLAGLRTGWVAGPPEVIATTRRSAAACSTTPSLPLRSSTARRSSNAASRSCAAISPSSTSGWRARCGFTTCGRAPAPPP